LGGVTIPRQFLNPFPFPLSPFPFEREGLLLDGKSGIFFALKTSSHKIHYLSSKVDSLKLNQWHHVAATYNGQQMKVYVDGVEKATKAIADKINYEPENDLMIGTYKDNNEIYPFAGKITEVRIWKVARTQQEIQQNMHQHLQGNELGLVGYWLLNEGTNNIAYDKTSNANHGIINGANWVQSEVPLTSTESNLELGVTKTMTKEKKTTNSSQVPQNKTEEQKTSQNQQKTEEIKSHLLATGLEDYGFWWQEMAKKKSEQSEPDKPFRRGRIWT
jgi:cyanobactin cluster PatC/TenC/TruC protein